MQNASVEDFGSVVFKESIQCKSEQGQPQDKLYDGDGGIMHRPFNDMKRRIVVRRCREVGCRREFGVGKGTIGQRYASEKVHDDTCKRRTMYDTVSPF